MGHLYFQGYKRCDQDYRVVLKEQNICGNTAFSVYHQLRNVNNELRCKAQLCSSADSSHGLAPPFSPQLYVCLPNHHCIPDVVQSDKDGNQENVAGVAPLCAAVRCRAVEVEVDEPAWTEAALVAKHLDLAVVDSGPQQVRRQVVQAPVGPHTQRREHGQSLGIQPAYHSKQSYKV